MQARRRIVFSLALLGAATAVAGAAALRDCRASKRTAPPIASASETPSLGSACDLPLPPAVVPNRDLIEAMKSPEACKDLVLRRLDYLDAYQQAVDRGCSAPPIEHGHRYVLELSKCLPTMAPGDSYSDAYERAIRAVPHLPWRPVDCLALATALAVVRNVPQAAPRMFAQLPTETGALPDCSGPGLGLARVDPGFAAWLSERPDRLRRAMSVESFDAPAWVEAESSGRRTDPLVVRAHINGRYAVRAMLDTGSINAVMMTRAYASLVGLAGHSIGERTRACMDCESGEVQLAWLDELVVGDKRLVDVPVEIVEGKPAHEVILGASLLHAVGGLTIEWRRGRDPFVAFGSPSGCSRPLPAMLGPHGRLWVRVRSPAGDGERTLQLDTGSAADYTLDDRALPDVPPAWRAIARGDHRVLYVAPGLAALPAGAAQDRLVRRLESGGRAVGFTGSDGYVSHWAMAPLRTCLSFDPPGVAVE